MGYGYCQCAAYTVGGPACGPTDVLDGNDNDDDDDNEDNDDDCDEDDDVDDDDGEEEEVEEAKPVSGSACPAISCRDSHLYPGNTFGDPADCGRYLQCPNGLPVSQSCGPGRCFSQVHCNYLPCAAV